MNILTASRKREWLPVAAVAAVRFLLVTTLLFTGHLKPFVGDNAVNGYLPIAERLITRGVFNDMASRTDSKYPPLYPVTIAVFRSIGISPQGVIPALVLFQNLCDIATAFLMFWVAHPFFGPVVATVSSIMWLVFPPGALISTWITAETMFTTALILSLAVLLGGPRRGWPMMRTVIGAGVALSVATLIRATPMGMAPLLVLVLWRWWGWRPALGFALAFGLPILPWTVRNYVVFNDRIPVAVGFGSVFLQGSSSEVFYGYNKPILYPIWEAEAEARGIHKPADEMESKIDRWLVQLGQEQYRKRWEANPWSFPEFLALKFVRLWCGTEAGDWRRHLALLAMSALFVFPGLVGFASRARRLAGTMPGAICLVALGYFVCLHFVALPQIRYMVPIYPLLMVATAARAVLGARPGSWNLVDLNPAS